MSPHFTLDGLKQQAKLLRRTLEADGQTISHGKSLELIARQHGFRDWNTLHASIGNRPEMYYAIGNIVSGHYLGQPFVGEIIAVSSLGGGKRTQLTLRFDEPVDVITFEGWSSFRKQVNATVDQFGETAEKTSNGLPHLVLDVV